MPEVPDVPPLSSFVKTPPNPAAASDIVDLLLAYALISRRYDGLPREFVAEASADLQGASETLAGTAGNFSTPAEVVAVFRTKPLEMDGRLLSHESVLLLLNDVESILAGSKRTLAALFDLHAILEGFLKFLRSSQSTLEENKRKTQIKRALAMERKSWWFCCWVGDMRRLQQSQSPSKVEKETQNDILGRLHTAVRLVKVTIQMEAVDLQRRSAAGELARKQLQREASGPKIEEIDKSLAP